MESGTYCLYVICMMHTLNILLAASISLSIYRKRDFSNGKYSLQQGRLSLFGHNFAIKNDTVINILMGKFWSTSLERENNDLSL